MFGLRSDGRKIKSLDPMFRVIPHVMKERSDAHVYFSQDIPIKSLDEYISKKEWTKSLPSEMYTFHSENRYLILSNAFCML